MQLVIELGDSRVAGVYTTRCIRRQKGKGRVLGVKLRPGGFRPFRDRPASELRNRALPLITVFGEEAASLDQRALAHATIATGSAAVKGSRR